MIIIIGLPGSGKTYLMNQFNMKIYDDFISNFFNGELIDELNENKDICIADPRLCDKEIFLKYMEVIEEIVDKSQISLILYKNNKEQCLINSKHRNRKKVETTIERLSKIYNPYDEIYMKYKNEIIDVFY